MYRGRTKRLWAVIAAALIAGSFASGVWAGALAAREQAARDDLELFLEASSAGWAEATKRFFAVPEAAAQTIGGLSAEADYLDERLHLLAEVIRGQESLDAAFLAYPDGGFEFVARSDEISPDGFRTRVISIDRTGERRVEIGYTDAAFDMVRSAVDPEDTYDPTTRPWYRPIADGADGNWTAPYLFASSQQPGITHSAPVFDEAGELIAVAGVDIRLTDVGVFLDALRPGENGVALLVDDHGRVVGESLESVDPIAVAIRSGAPLVLDDAPELAQLVADLGDVPDAALLQRSEDGLRTTVVRAAGARNEWYLAVRALDADFIEDDRASEVFSFFAVGLAVAALVAALGLGLLRYLDGLVEEAEIDELTGIYNRRAIRRELAEALRAGPGPIEVAILDLDEFKAINDEHGHGEGDAVLAAVGERLRDYAAPRDGMIVGRLGGDEFIVVSRAGAADWPSLEALLRAPIDTGDHRFVVTASIGVTRAQDLHSLEVEDLFRSADHVLFEVKRRGGAGHELADLAR